MPLVAFDALRLETAAVKARRKHRHAYVPLKNLGKGRRPPEKELHRYDCGVEEVSALSRNCGMIDDDITKGSFLRTSTSFVDSLPDFRNKLTGACAETAITCRIAIRDENLSQHAL